MFHGKIKQDIFSQNLRLKYICALPNQSMEQVSMNTDKTVLQLSLIRNRPACQRWMMLLKCFMVLYEKSVIA